jgi:hypothetical protein
MSNKYDKVERRFSNLEIMNHEMLNKRESSPHKLRA